MLGARRVWKSGVMIRIRLEPPSPRCQYLPSLLTTPTSNRCLSQIAKMHDENVKPLQDPIALPSIAAENRNSRFITLLRLACVGW